MVTMTERFTCVLDFPQEYVEQYTKKMLYLHDPIIKASAITENPLSWNRAFLDQRSQQALQVMNMASNWNILKSGVVAGCRSGLSSAEIGFLSLSGISLNHRTTLILKSIMPPVISAMKRIRAKQAQCKITPRQKTVLSMIKDGLTNEQIAEQLNCSIDNVKKHSINLLERLDSFNRAHLASEAQRLGI